jgi:hypothetical protein
VRVKAILDFFALNRLQNVGSSIRAKTPPTEVLSTEKRPTQVKLELFRSLKLSVLASPVAAGPRETLPPSPESDDLSSFLQMRRA